MFAHNGVSKDDDPGRVEQSLTGMTVPWINGFCCHCKRGKEKLPRGARLKQDKIFSKYCEEI